MKSFVKSLALQNVFTFQLNTHIHGISQQRQAFQKILY